MSNEVVLFRERQWLARWVLIVVVVAGFILPLFAVLRSLSSGVPVNYWFIGFLAAIQFIALGLFATMRTTVTNEELRVTFGLLRLIGFSYSLDSIKSVERREYHPMKEYGGWGIKGTKRNRALSMQGTSGVQLIVEMRDGDRRLLIGSQRAEELWHALQEAKHQSGIISSER